MQARSAVDASYAHCRQIAKRAGSSFFTSFFLLPRQKRKAMWALYAFLRHSDDLSDCEASDTDAASRRAALAAWRRSLERALTNEFDDPLLPALKDTVDRYQIPHEYLTAAIDGMEMDLGPCRYATFDDLKRYCYRVASVVGLACIHVWGFTDQAALAPATDCGIAFQLTNILRDLKEDVLRDRVYLPQEDLDRFGYTVDDMRAHICDERFRNLMAFEIERAQRYYSAAAPLTCYLSNDGKPIFSAMVTTYHGLLDEIQRADGNVFRSRIRVGRLRKMWIAAHALFSGRISVSVGTKP